MQLANYFSEIFKLMVFVSQQIDQWFDRINLLNDDLGSTFTAMLYGSIGGRKAYLKLEGAPNIGFVVIQGARWIEQENLALGHHCWVPKVELNSSSWQLIAKRWAPLVALIVKSPPALRETWVRSLGWEDPLQEGMAAHSSILAWRILVDWGAWWPTVRGVTKSWTWLSD